MSSLERWSPYGLSLLRIVAALLFMQHGMDKLFGFPGPAPTTMTALTLAQGALEVFGGLALLVGLYARPVAFVLSGDMAVAYFTAHLPRSFYPVLNGGDSAVLYCFVFFYIIFAGAGPVSVDDRLLNRRQGAESRRRYSPGAG